MLQPLCSNFRVITAIFWVSEYVGFLLYTYDVHALFQRSDGLNGISAFCLSLHYLCCQALRLGSGNCLPMLCFVPFSHRPFPSLLYPHLTSPSKTVLRGYCFQHVQNSVLLSFLQNLRFLLYNFDSFCPILSKFTPHLFNLCNS